MRRSFGIVLVVAIALSSCQAGLKNQIQGKWKTISDRKVSCIYEYLEKYVTTTCTLGEEKLFTVTSSYEVDGSDRIVFTSSKGVKDVFTVKINGDQMETQKVGSDQWVKYSKIK